MDSETFQSESLLIREVEQEELRLVKKNWSKTKKTIKKIIELNLFGKNTTC